MYKENKDITLQYYNQNAGSFVSGTVHADLTDTLNRFLMYFQDLDVREQYDGIWACSSILHLEQTELRSVLKKMADALRPDGWIYTSFKYGEFEGMRNGRYFTDFTWNSFQRFIRDTKSLSIEESWVTGDVRPGREEEKWLNLLLQKR